MKVGQRIIYHSGYPKGKGEERRGNWLWRRGKKTIERKS